MKKDIKFGVNGIWGMGWEDTVFSTKERAEESLKEVDWSLADTTLDEAENDSLVTIEEIDII